MALGRQVRLRSGGVILDLNSAQYVLLANGGWTSAGEALEIKFRVPATSLVELDRLLAPLRRLVGVANAADQGMVGTHVEVWTKTCDDLAPVAELGPTWMRKRVTGGSVLVQPVTGMAAVPDATVVLSLAVERYWRRAAPASVLVNADDTGSFQIVSDGRLYVGTGSTLLARRLSWTGTVGLTVRTFFAGFDTVTLFEAGTVRAWWDVSDGRFHIRDAASHQAQSAPFDHSPGVEVAFVWSPGQRMTIYINGSKNGEVLACTAFANADLYTVCGTTLTAPAYLQCVQVWPEPLSDAQIAALQLRGRPEEELLYTLTPSPVYGTENSSAKFDLLNIPGDAPAALRVTLEVAAGSFTQLQVLAGLKALGTLAAHRWECEDGWLGPYTIETGSITGASGSTVARFAPDNASHWTTLALTLASTAAELQALRGEYRLMLACRDHAASANLNQFRWRPLWSGIAGEYSDAISAAEVATLSLVDLGVLLTPDGQRPDESYDVSSPHVSPVLEIEFEAWNTAGSGAMDFDALFLVPVEREGTLSLALAAGGAQTALLDFSGNPPSFLGVWDWRTLEFGVWGEYAGDVLDLLPGGNGTLVLFWLRGTAEEASMSDVMHVRLFYEPRWDR